jgi:putative CocE/NonD family hydrolase
LSGAARSRLYGVELVRNCALPASGGAELAADVYLPQGAPPGPAVVTLLPYNKDGLGGITTWDVHHHFAARGYPCVIADSRGTGSSPGRPLPPFHPDEGRDGVALVEWAADQPWCDGSVGMWGVSYAATTTLRTAALAPRPLRAIAPVMAFLDPERDFIHPSGRRGCLALGLWGLSTLAQHLTPPLLQDAEGRWEGVWRERVEQGEPYILDLLRHGPGDPAWRSRVVDASRIRIPAFCVTGWRDLTCDPTIRAYERIRAPKRLLVGPWTHTLPDESPLVPVGFLALLTGWWERWLRGKGDAAEGGARPTVYVQGRESWRTLVSWPPDAASVHMFALPGGRLGGQPSAEFGVAERAMDPAAGAASALWGVPARGSGRPADQREEDEGSLAFTSEPLAASLGICGRPRARVTIVGFPGPHAVLVVRLVHVDADGRSTLVSSGTISLPALEPNGDPASEVWSAHELELVAAAYEVPAGGRIRMVLATADFPRLWPDPAAPALRVRWGGDATALELPAIRVEGLEIAELPAPQRGGDQSSLVRRAEPLSAVTRGVGQVWVRAGEHLVVWSPGERRAVDVNAHASATVQTARPAATTVRGRSTTRATVRTGELVVRAEVRIDGDDALAFGEVELDGRELFSRHFEP